MSDDPQTPPPQTPPAPGGPFGPQGPADHPPPIPPPRPNLYESPAPIPSIQGPHAPRLYAMRVGELLDGAIKLYRQNWKLFMGIVAFVLVPIQFVQSFLTRSVVPSSPFSQSNQLPTQSDIHSTFLIGSIFTGLAFLFVLPFLTAAIARATSEVYVEGSPKVGDIYRFALSRTASVLWASFLVFLMVGLGFIALVIPGIIFAIRYGFTTTVVAIEGRRGTKAMGRSWRLAQGFFWKILGTTLLATILAGIVGSILQIPLAIVADHAGSSGWVLRAVGGSAAAIVTRPFTGIIVVLLYFDMRIRKEGFDLALMAQEIVDRPQI